MKNKMIIIIILIALILTACGTTASAKSIHDNLEGEIVCRPGGADRWRFEARGYGPGRDRQASIGAFAALGSDESFGR